MRIGFFRRRVLPIAILSALLLFAPQPAASQEGISENLREIDNPQTSTRGILQQRLAAAHPDSLREGVEIFWEPRDGWISEEVYLWWLSRLAEEGIHGVRRESAERMFSQISEQGPVFSASRKKICAVVGASAYLLDSQYGKLIDAHDLVFRVNRAPTHDYESWTEGQLFYPSTGFIALMLALHVCDEVDLFGFGADALGRWDRYYADDPVDVSRFHPGDIEGRLWREIDEKGMFNVFYGNRPDPKSGSTAPPQN